MLQEQERQAFLPAFAAAIARKCAHKSDDIKFKQRNKSAPLLLSQTLLAKYIVSVGVCGPRKLLEEGCVGEGLEGQKPEYWNQEREPGMVVCRHVSM